jgi:hypothetical protein
MTNSMTGKNKAVLVNNVAIEMKIPTISQAVPSIAKKPRGLPVEFFPETPTIRQTSKESGKIAMPPTSSTQILAVTLNAGDVAEAASQTNPDTKAPGAPHAYAARISAWRHRSDSVSSIDKVKPNKLSTDFTKRPFA